MSWIVSAGEDRARIFDLQGTEIKLLESLHHDAQASELSSSRPPPARRPDRRPVNRAFARELAEKLRYGRRAGKYESLVLIAEPGTLASLHRALDPVTRGLLVASIPEDLYTLGPQELFTHLPPRCVS